MTDQDDEQLGRLYRTAISQLPGGRPDATLARATARTRQRTRRRAAGGIVAVVTVTVLVAVTSPWFEGAGTVAVPASGGGPAPSVCPALRPGTSNATADYVETFRWNDQTYITSNNLAEPRKAGKLGRPVTTVTCSIAELTADNGNLVENGPWPNGTATFLPTGTQVYAIQGVPTRCELGVRDTSNTADGSVKLFVAVRQPDWKPLC
ncbi:hypothetical protein [uncultured Friedmanniella sp.]|uniref:hypothetical protein n=1 Tax=uncultured Friedmanniella sp. TaxID=335381 RepID=UPI0035C9BBF6